MANEDKPMGGIVVGRVGAVTSNHSTEQFLIPSSDSNNYFIGDFVDLAGTANSTVISNGTTEHAIGTLPTITKATAGDNNPIVGVITGFEGNPDDNGVVYGKASTNRVAKVCTDPDVLLLIQCDSGANLAVTDIGANANLVFTHAGSTTTGRSGDELNIGAGSATTQTYQLKIHRVSTVRGRNEVGAAHCVVEASINNHRYARYYKAGI